MIRRSLVLVLVVTFMYATVPSMAEDAALPLAPSPQDAVSAKSLPLILQHRSSLGLMSNPGAFPDGQSQPSGASGQNQPPPSTTPSKPAASAKQWSTRGKILTVVGAALVGAGAIEMTRGNTPDCSGNTCSQINWKATGGITMGAGAVLLLVGLAQRH